jgi:hypothetical protein
MVADSFQPLCAGEEVTLPKRGGDVTFVPIRLSPIASAAGRGTIVSRKDLDAVMHVAHAFNAGSDFLSDLLEIMGGKAALQMDNVAACDTRDIAKREVAATSNSDLGLTADRQSVGTA